MIPAHRRACGPRTAVGSAAIAAAILPLATPAREARPAIPPLDRCAAIHQHAVSMAEALKDLADRFHIQSVSDGTPLRERADVDSEGTVREALDRIADAFDYSWRPSSTGVILLTKRFKNPDERPQLNLAELRQTVKDILTALPPVPLNDDYEVSERALKMLAVSFTPAQRGALAGGAKLAAGDLSPEQRRLVANCILHHSFGAPRAMWDRLYFQLANMDASEIRAVDPASKPPAAPETRLHYVMHIARDRHGRVVEERLGELQKEVRP